MHTLWPRRAGWLRALISLAIVLAPVAEQVAPDEVTPMQTRHSSPASLVAQMVARGDDAHQWHTMDPKLPSPPTVLGATGTRMLHLLSGAIVGEWAKLYAATAVTAVTGSPAVAAGIAPADPAAGAAAAPPPSGPWQPPGQPSWVATGQYTIEAVNKKGFAFGSTVTAKVTEQHTGVQVTQETTDQGAISCPAADGTVTGHFESGAKTTATVPAGGGSSAFQGWRVVSGLSGRVGDNARLIDYDLTVAVTLTGAGHMVNQQTGQVSQSPTSQATITYTFSGLKLGEHLSLAQILFGRFKSTVKVSGPIDKSAAKIGAQTLVQLAQLFIDDLLQRAQHGWDEEAACLPVKFAPDPLQLAPGASEQVSVGVTSRLDGLQVDIELTATPPSGGSVAPTTAHTNGATADFRVTAPRDKGNYSLSVEGVSRRGRARASLPLSLLEPILVYTIAYSGSAQYNSDIANGNSRTTIRAHFVWASHVVGVQFNKQLLSFPGAATVVVGMPFRALDGSLAGHYTAPQEDVTCTAPLQGINYGYSVGGHLTPSGADFYIPATGEVKSTSNINACSFSLGYFQIQNQSSPPVPSISASGPFYNPTEGLTAHVRLTWATLEQTAIGQSFRRTVSGPMAPFLPPANCNFFKAPAYSCRQSLAWQGGITFTRTG